MREAVDLDDDSHGFIIATGPFHNVTLLSHCQITHCYCKILCTATLTATEWFVMTFSRDVHVASGRIMISCSSVT